MFDGSSTFGSFRVFFYGSQNNILCTDKKKSIECVIFYDDATRLQSCTFIMTYICYVRNVKEYYKHCNIMSHINRQYYTIMMYRLVQCIYASYWNTSRDWTTIASCIIIIILWFVIHIIIYIYVWCHLHTHNIIVVLRRVYYIVIVLLCGRRCSSVTTIIIIICSYYDEPPALGCAY